MQLHVEHCLQGQIRLIKEIEKRKRERHKKRKKIKREANLKRSILKETYTRNATRSIKIKIGWFLEQYHWEKILCFWENKPQTETLLDMLTGLIASCPYLHNLIHGQCLSVELQAGNFAIKLYLTVVRRSYRKISLSCQFHVGSNRLVHNHAVIHPHRRNACVIIVRGPYKIPLIYFDNTILTQ